MNTTPEPSPSKRHISSRVIAFGGAGASFGAVIALALGRTLTPLQSIALYLFSISLPILLTAGLLFEFIAFGDIREDDDTVGACFTLAGYLSLGAAISILLASMDWTYVLAFLLPSIVGVFTLKLVVRR